MVFLHPLNAPFFTEIFFLKVNFFKALQFLKALWFIFVAPGADRDASFLQPLNAFLGMLLMLVPKDAFFSFAEFLNALLPMAVTLYE